MRQNRDLSLNTASSKNLGKMLLSEVQEETISSKGKAKPIPNLM